MHARLLRLGFILAVTVLFVPFLGEFSSLSAAPPLRWPFAPSADWRFLQGYNGSTHNCDGYSCYQRYGIDLVRQDDKTAGQPVYAMTTGEVAWIDMTNKCLSLDIGGGYFQITCHVDGIGKYEHGDTVKQGDQIGTVGGPAGDNGGLPHIHVGVYKAKTWQADSPSREPVPFNGLFAVESSNYPADNDKSNQYVGTIVKSALPLPAAPLVPSRTDSLPTPTPTSKPGSPPAVPLTINPGLGAPNTLASLAAGAAGSAAGATRPVATSTPASSSSTTTLTASAAGGTTASGTTNAAARTVPDVPLTGDATATVSLSSGWNLFSVPLVPGDKSPASVFASIEGKYDAISTYKKGSGWFTYRPAQAAASDLDAIDSTMGLWIHMKQAATLSLSGKPVESVSLSLTKGWNLVGYPSSRTRPINEVFGTNSQIEKVMTFRATDESWYGYFPALDAIASDLDIAAPGRGYWINVSGDATIKIPW